jgi:hypothetical protein
MDIHGGKLKTMKTTARRINCNQQLIIIISYENSADGIFYTFQPITSFG